MCASRHIAFTNDWPHSKHDILDVGTGAVLEGTDEHIGIDSAAKCFITDTATDTDGKDAGHMHVILDGAAVYVVVDGVTERDVLHVDTADEHVLWVLWDGTDAKNVVWDGGTDKYVILDIA